MSKGRQPWIGKKHSAVSTQHSAFSEKQHQDQNQQQNQERCSTESTEEGKTLPLIHGKPGQVNADERKRVRERAEALVRRIGETCDELDRLAAENPELVGRVTSSAEEHKDAYVRLKARLELADAAPRCRWVRQDGTSCGSPQLKKHIYCFAHVQMMEARALALNLPAPEDANAIQIGIMRIQKALIEGTISTKTAGLLLYSMQLALQNVGQTTFGQAKTQEPVRETVSEEEALSEKALSNQQSAFSQSQHQHQNRFTAEGAEDAEQIGSSENQNLPRMSADGRGLQGVPREVEWKPTPDKYRMDTREGMEAYEASFRMKIMTTPGGERMPVQAVIGSEAPAEPL